MHANCTKKEKTRVTQRAILGVSLELMLCAGVTPYAVVASLYNWDRRACICTVERKVTEKTKRHTCILNREVACFLVTMQSTLRALVTVNGIR